MTTSRRYKNKSTKTELPLALYKNSWLLSWLPCRAALQTAQSTADAAKADAAKAQAAADAAKAAGYAAAAEAAQAKV